MDIVMVGLEILRRWLPRIGPYIVAEVIPDGTLLALSLYLYRCKQLTETTI